MMLARERQNKEFGVIILAEGLAEFLPAEYLEGVKRDEHQHIANELVDIERGHFSVNVLEHRRYACDHLTSTMTVTDNALDGRLRFVVDFPFPDAGQRAEIWRRVFPPAAPTERLDVTKLARLRVTGGFIANIALNAAFRAAETGSPLRMSHLLQAAGAECAKNDRPLNEMEVEGWA